MIRCCFDSELKDISQVDTLLVQARPSDVTLHNSSDLFTSFVAFLDTTTFINLFFFYLHSCLLLSVKVDARGFVLFGLQLSWKFFRGYLWICNYIREQQKSVESSVEWSRWSFCLKQLVLKLRKLAHARKIHFIPSRSSN